MTLADWFKPKQQYWLISFEYKLLRIDGVYHKSEPSFQSVAWVGSIASWMLQYVFHQPRPNREPPTERYRFISAVQLTRDEWYQIEHWADGSVP